MTLGASDLASMSEEQKLELKVLMEKELERLLSLKEMKMVDVAPKEVCDHFSLRFSLWFSVGLNCFCRKKLRKKCRVERNQEKKSRQRKGTERRQVMLHF